MFDKIARSGGYWTLLLITGLLMEGIALYYQYGLDYGPCVLCIHVRIYVAALILISLLALLIRESRGGRLFCHFGSFLLAAGLAERSWKLLAIERGWLESACSMDSGLPDWFALDRWWPQLFEVWEACGYTPELPGGITMAEGLSGAAAGLLFVTLLLTFSTLLNKPRRSIFAD
ncbi:MAG: disulfide bond formation protein B [Marinobacterium sp.]|nr:disulfide bond formation protein B [Marinobacterium sp.]